MSELRIETAGDKKSFRPGEEITGLVGWKLEKPAEAVELRLFWYTKGKGDVDAGVVETVRYDDPRQMDGRQFRLRVPEGPYSFSGMLISLVWALELVVEPSRETERLELTISPTGEEIILKSERQEPKFVRKLREMIEPRTDAEGAAEGEGGEKE